MRGNIIKILKLIFIILLCLGSLLVIFNFFIWFSKLNTNVIAAIITASIGFIGLMYSQISSKKREIFESHRAKKMEVYDIFFSMVEIFQDESLNKEEKLDDEFRNQYTKLTRGLSLWASPGVIKAYLEFRATAVEGSTSTEILKSVDKVYKEIRKDLGNSNLTLQSGDLIKLNLKDPKELSD